MARQDMKAFVNMFLQDMGTGPEDVGMQQLPSEGSTRVFWRITASTLRSGLVAMSNPPSNTALRRENSAYAMIGNHLHRKGVPVPEIYRYDLEIGQFIMEDMGETCLQDMVVSSRDPLPMYENVLEHLVKLQIRGAEDFDRAWCCQTERYDYTVMRRYEADYFRDAFLSLYLGLKKEWPELEICFNHLAETASRADGRFFVHRDFQSRNLMVSDGKVGIVDWQGGRLGPLGYDLASLIIDPYAQLSLQQMSTLYDRYVDMIGRHSERWAESIKVYYPYLAIQRNLQILGAFAYLTRIKGKSSFEVHIPAALSSLDHLLHQVKDSQLFFLRSLVDDLQSRQGFQYAFPRGHEEQRKNIYGG